jgi:hypothetical protein
MISLHMKPDCETSVTWDVVDNGETASPIGEVKVYDRDLISFIPASTQEIPMYVLYQLVKAFPQLGGEQ